MDSKIVPLMRDYETVGKVEVLYTGDLIIGVVLVEDLPDDHGLKIEHPKLPWGVHYNLAHDGGGSEWTKYYKTKIGARVAAFWHRNVASWGGTTKLFDTKKEN